MWKLLKLDQVDFKRMGVLIWMLTAATFFGKYELGEWQWVLALLGLVGAFLMTEWLARRSERTDLSKLMQDYMKLREKEKNAGNESGERT